MHVRHAVTTSAASYASAPLHSLASVPSPSLRTVATRSSPPIPQKTIIQLGGQYATFSLSCLRLCWSRWSLTSLYNSCSEHKSRRFEIYSAALRLSVAPICEMTGLQDVAFSLPRLECWLQGDSQLGRKRFLIFQVASIPCDQNFSLTKPHS